MEVILSFEFAFESEFADEQMVIAAFTPQHGVGLGSHAFPEIEHAEILRHHGALVTGHDSSRALMRPGDQDPRLAAVDVAAVVKKPIQVTALTRLIAAAASLDREDRA